MCFDDPLGQVEAEAGPPVSTTVTWIQLAEECEGAFASVFGDPWTKIRDADLELPISDRALQFDLFSRSQRERVLEDDHDRQHCQLFVNEESLLKQIPGGNETDLPFERLEVDVLESSPNDRTGDHHRPRRPRDAKVDVNGGANVTHQAPEPGRGGRDAAHLE